MRDTKPDASDEAVILAVWGQRRADAWRLARSLKDTNLSDSAPILRKVLA